MHSFAHKRIFRFLRSVILYFNHASEEALKFSSEQLNAHEQVTVITFNIRTNKMKVYFYFLTSKTAKKPITYYVIVKQGIFLNKKLESLSIYLNQAIFQPLQNLLRIFWEVTV